MNGQFSSISIKKPLALLSILAVMALVLAACAPIAPGAASSSDTIDVATNPTFGKILVTGQGMTLYIFTKDTPDQSNCNASCLANWPLLVASGAPRLGSGVDASLVGTAKLSNGEKIITYDHKPLYTFIKDTKPGQTNGQDVVNAWFVIAPDGTPIETTNSSTPAATIAATLAASSAEATINVATSSSLGQYLVDGKGMTLYAFTKDGPNQSNCNAACLAKWPPLLTNGQPNLGTGIVADGIGTATLSDGSKIVTYFGMPLYTFIGDTGAGQTNGIGIGGFWFAVAPDGMLLGLPASATPTPATSAPATPTTAPNMTSPTPTP